MRIVSITSFIKELERLVALGFPTREVHDYLRTTLIEPDSLEPYVTFGPDRYTRNLIHKIPAFELLAVGWDIGQRAPIHGHEGERCWARVERGTLRFTNYREVETAPLKLESLGESVEGGRGHLDGPADIHAVENPSSFNERAVSLHLYSYPFAECDIYDLAQGVKRRVRLVYDTEPGKAVAPVP